MTKRACFLLFAIISCTGDRRASHDSLHRDSAGVDIVQNAATSQRRVDWTVAPEPLLVIRQNEDSLSHSPLDPASVYRIANGNLIVADGASAGRNQLLVFDRAGVYVASMGRAGKGPCEFQQLSWAAPYIGDSIGAYDYATHAITVFDRAGKCGRTFGLPHTRAKAPAGTVPFSEGADGFFNDGNVLAYSEGAVTLSAGDATPWYQHQLLRISTDGKQIDTLGVFNLMEANWNGSQQLERPFAPFALRTPAGRGFLYSSADRFEFSRYDLDGRLRQIVRNDEPPPLLSDTEKQEFIDAFVERIRIAPFEGGKAAAERARVDLVKTVWPASKPALGELIVDSLGYVWAGDYANPITAGHEPGTALRRWQIFRADGVRQGSLQMPARFRPMSIYADAVYGLWKDEDDVTEIRVYALARRH